MVLPFINGVSITMAFPSIMAYNYGFPIYKSLITEFSHL